MTGRRFLKENITNAFGAGVVATAVVFTLGTGAVQYYEGPRVYLQQVPCITGTAVTSGGVVSLVYLGYLALKRRKKQ
jgi:hypothetical protein